jgi:hypothetical protein
MTRADAQKIVLAEVSFNGTPALFSELRLEPETVPKSLYVYEMRHIEGDPFKPIEVSSQVYENFYGTLITPKVLSLFEAGHITLPDHFAFDFKQAPVTTLSEFAAARHIKEAQAKNKDAYER